MANVRRNLTPELHSYLLCLLAQLYAIEFWKPMDLILLAAPAVEKYFGPSGLTFFYLTATTSGAVIGEQALVEEARRYPRLTRNATLVALTTSKLYCLKKKDFQESIGGFVRRHQAKRLAFFQDCFKHLVSFKSIPNFMVMFQGETFNRGEFICKKGEPLDRMYVIEQGEVGILAGSPLSARNSKRVVNLQGVNLVRAREPDRLAREVCAARRRVAHRQGLFPVLRGRTGPADSGLQSGERQVLERQVPRRRRRHGPAAQLYHRTARSPSKNSATERPASCSSRRR